ncbi:GGDEF domain-containing protein [Butyrivibrio sp. WCD3002]|uniref:GGDEF domain-containing protein n=1 Tax=Butyrivibrio sp. WCD3002 TaxID=1280676 RepID=UPI00040227DC|nr:GGDEF domain-containing protein [Butyrivibrio sp. WCD3002]
MRLRDYLHINVWLLPIILILLPIALTFFGSSYLSTPNEYYNIQLDSGWSVSHGDYHYEDVHLKNFNLGQTKKGDIVTMTNVLPDTSVPAAAIMFRSILSAVSVSINGEKVYEYGQDYADRNLILPKHYNYISIPDNAIGKTVEISFFVTEDNAFSGISPVYYGNLFEIERSYLQSKRLDLFIGVFLCLFGFMLLTLSSYLFMYHGQDLSLIFSSVISLNLGSYILCYNDLFNFIGDNDFYFCVMEYVTLYSIPFSIIVFLVSTHPELNTRLAKIFISINILFPLITLILQLINVVHINYFVSILHILAILEAAILLPRLVMNIFRQYRTRKDSPEYAGMTSDSILILGLVVFIFCCVIDIAKYNFFNEFGGGGVAYTNITFMNLGALCFVMSLFVFYFYHGIEHINAAYVKEHLEGLAYTDPLTGLMNRAKCMQYMATVRGNYALISIDMDNLKPVNDTLGHLEGDRMIRCFADILKQAFYGSALIGRTGGDEFLVAIENPEPEICEKLIDKMETLMAVFNDTDKKIKLSASCGFAYSTEPKLTDANSVFILADTRMYRIKEQHHEDKLSKFLDDIISGKISQKGGESSL